MASYYDAEIDLYDILKIPSTATKAEIKKAYHKAALQNHPDKVPEDQKEESEQKFKEISKAYEILHDEEKRQLYDIYGLAAFDSTRGGPNRNTEAADMEDILSEMFGMGMGASGFSAQKPSKSHNEEQEYQVTLEELYKGKTVKFASTKNVICSHCKGSGGKERAKHINCDKCKGKGVTINLRSEGPGMLTQERVTCSNCSGLGKLFKEKDRCKKCKGKRITSEKKVLEIHIPKGSQSRERIVLEGEADQVPNQKPGDLIFTLCQDEHEVFSRYGDNLFAEIFITLTEALTGFNRVVLKHLDGRGIRIDHLKGKIMRPGQTLKVKGEGMPLKNSFAKGDLYLTVRIDFPDDNWAQNSTNRAEITKILHQPAPVIEADDVLDVDFESDADPNEFQEHSGDWETSDDNDDDDDDDDYGGTPQCAQQ